MILLLSVISSLSVLIPFVVGLSRADKEDPVEIKFLWLMGITVVVELLNMISKYFHLNSFYHQNLYLLLSTLFFLVIYRSTIKNKIAQSILAVLVFLCIIIWIINVNILGWSILNSYNFIFLFTVSNIASAYMLIQLINDVSEPLFTKPVFWIASGTFIYCASTIMLYALSDFIIMKAGVLNNYFWIFHFFINVTVNILYAITFTCRRFNKAIS